MRSLTLHGQSPRMVVRVRWCPAIRSGDSARKVPWLSNVAEKRSVRPAQELTRQGQLFRECLQIATPRLKLLTEIFISPQDTANPSGVVRVADDAGVESLGSTLGRHRGSSHNYSREGLLLTAILTVLASALQGACCAIYLVEHRF